jgi:hypothetical protein
MNATRQAPCILEAYIIYYIPFCALVLLFSSPHVYFLYWAIHLRLSAPNPLFSVWFWSLAKVSLKFNDQFLVFLFILAVRREKAVSTIEGHRAT